MKCPECGNQMRKGKVKIIDMEHLLIPRVVATWCLDEEKEKIIKKNAVSLKLEAVSVLGTCKCCLPLLIATRVSRKNRP